MHTKGDLFPFPPPFVLIPQFQTFLRSFHERSGLCFRRPGFPPLHGRLCFRTHALFYQVIRFVPHATSSFAGRPFQVTL